MRFAHRSSPFGWGLLDQICASATTFILTVTAARTLGPGGVGTIALGLAALALPLALQRACLIDPYATRPSGTERFDDGEALAAAASVTLVFAVSASVAFEAVGALLAQGGIARSLRIFSPLVLPALAQALVRAAAYRARKERLAAAGSAGGLLTFSASALIWHRSATELATCWGVSALVAGAVVSCGLDGLRLSGPASSARWFRAEALEFGRWLTAASLVYTVGIYVVISALAGIVGTAAVGGYRAIESVFSPLSLLAPGLTNPGVQAMRRYEGDEGRAWRLAVALGIAAGGATFAYAATASAVPGLVEKLYGAAFDEYRPLILPIACGQFFTALAIGPSALIRARRRGRSIFAVAATTFAVSAGAAIPLALGFGLSAAAWGIAAGAFLGCAVTYGAAAIPARAVDSTRRVVPQAEPQVRVT